MALPTYKTRGISYANLPSIDTSSLRETSKLYQSLDSRLEQLSSFAFEKEAKEAKQAALQYAADNPVTEDQIQAAMEESGAEKSMFETYFGGNIYEETLRAAQAKTLSTQLLMDSTKKFAEIKAAGEAGYKLVDGETIPFSSADASAEIKDMIDGYAATVSAFDPQTSINLRASLATKGNSALTSIHEKEQKRILSDMKVKIAQASIELESSLTDIYSTPESKLPELVGAGRKMTHDEKAKLELQPFVNLATRFEDTEGAKKLVDMQRKAKKAGFINQAFGEDARISPAGMLSGIDNNDLPPDLKKRFKSFTAEEKKAVRTEIFDRIKQRNDAQKQEDTKIEKFAKKRKGELEMLLMSMGDSMSEIERKDFVQEMLETNIVAPGTYSQTMIEQVNNGTFFEDKASDDEIADYRAAARKGLLTEEMTEKYVDAGKISGKQRIELDNFISSLRSKSVVFAEKTLKRKVQGMDGISQKMFNKRYKTEILKDFDEYRAAYPDTPVDEAADLVFERFKSSFNQGALEQKNQSVVNAINSFRSRMPEQYKAKNIQELVDQMVDGKLSPETVLGEDFPTKARVIQLINELKGN